MLAKSLLLTLLILSPAAFHSDVDVPVIREHYSRWCMVRVNEENAVISEAEFKKVTAEAEARNCSRLKDLKVDFARETLLHYRVRGDCFVHATANVTRDDELKKYTLRVTRRWGGCRAAGSFEGWMVIEKLREGYTVEQQMTEAKEKY